LPRQPLQLSALLEQLNQAYKAFTAGKFTDAIDLFRAMLHAVPLLVVGSRTEAQEVKELVTYCREYIVGLSLELKRKDLVAANPDANAARGVELAALFTHCQLQPRHVQLVLKLATNAAAKARCYALAEEFARRLLDQGPPQDLVEHAEKVLKLVEQKGRSDALKLNYDGRNPFKICGGTLAPIYEGSPSASCPYCGATFVSAAKGRKCPTCQLAEIGRQASGLLSVPPPRR